MRILCGVIGAVLGLFAGLFAFEVFGLSDQADPIVSGMLALFVFGPAGTVAGTMLGTTLAVLARREGGNKDPSDNVSTGNAETPRTPDAAAFAATAATGGGLATTILISLGIVVAAVAVAGTLYYAYAVSTATPWLNPNAGNPVLQFEVRLPSGTTLPPARDVAIELQTDLNRMPGEARAEKFRSDGDRSVITGEVELAFRTRLRQLEVKVAGQPDRAYQIRLTDRAPHASELGRWEAHPDGSEIRYRAKWPGLE